MNHLVLGALVTLGPPVAYGLLLGFLAWREKYRRRRDFRRRIARQRDGRITVGELRARLEAEDVCGQESAAGPRRFEIVRGSVASTVER